MRKEHILCCVSGPVFVVRHPEHLECKVLDVGCACRLDVDGVIWANLLLEAFEGVEEIEEKLAGIGVLRLEGYAQLCGVVGSWIAVSECWRGRETGRTPVRDDGLAFYEFLCALEVWSDGFETE